MRKLFLTLSTFSFLLSIPFLFRPSFVYAACVDADFHLLCRVDRPPFEDCVYVGGVIPCRGPDAATDRCECKEVNIPPREREFPKKCDDERLQSAIGCIPTSATGFASFFLKWFLGIAGVVAFFLILVAGFQIVTSAGDPEKLQGAKQLLTAAVIGLLFVVFAVVILQVLGITILGGLPGFPRFL